MTLSKRYLLAALVALSGTAQANSIDTIYQMALENDPQLRADKAAYEAGLQNKTIGRAGLLPQIDATGSYNVSDSETTYYISDRENVPLNTGIDSGVETTSWSLSLRQAIVDLSAWHTYKQGVARSEQAEAEYSAAQQELIVRVAEAYFNVLRAVDNYEATAAEEKALKQQLEQTKQRFEVGLTPITDVHDAQAAFDSAQAATVEDSGQVGIAYEALEVLTGQSISEIAPLEDQFPVVKPTPDDRHSWVEFALENNYSLKSARLNARASEQNAKAAKAGHYPTLTGSASYSDNDRESETYGITTEDRNQAGYSAGVELKVPLFSGFRTSGQRRQAMAQSMQADEQFNFQQRNVIQNTRSLHLSVETGVARVKARKQAIVSNESAVEATQAGFEVGTRNLVEVLLAQRSLYQARRDYSNALYDYIIQMISLRQAAGMLTPADIERIDGYLKENELVNRGEM